MLWVVPDLSRRELVLGLAALSCKSATREAPVTASAELMPTAFVAHGAPTLALDASKGEPLKRWGAALARPRGIVCVSAHWEDEPIAVEVGARPQTVHDFSGFPQELYELRYGAPGDPALAERVLGLLGSFSATPKERGWDHGVWVPLLHLFPRADVPLVQVSLPRGERTARVLELGRALAPLRSEGILILGSGNVVHNLRRMDRSEGAPPSWASEFDTWVADALGRSDLDALADFRARAPGARMAHPTAEHYTPLLVAAAAALGAAPTYPVSGFEYGSISRRSVQFG
jgi:4,5-DOPA dioxygenase extradiol